MLKQQNKSTTISDFYQGDNIFTQLNNSLFGQIKKIFEQNFLVLPKVIVIGTESSGKSSLLERITKCQLFPSDSKLCTKCPIKVKLQNGKPSYSIQLPNDTIQQLENKKDIYPIVQKYMNSLTHDFISENEIIINITDIDVPDFEFYDLPGIRTYPHKIAKLSVNICKKYLSDKNSIVLCVVPCTTTRLTSCQSIALITEAKMEHNTILALTMTDRLKLENIEELLINRIIYKTDELNGIKFANCLAVVNRTQYTNYSLDESDEMEKKWFDKNIYQCIPEEYEEFREQIIQRTTISNVLKNMDNLFNHFIHTDWIPRMKNEMRSKEEIINKILKPVITKDNFHEYKSCLLDYKSGYSVVKNDDGSLVLPAYAISIPTKEIRGKYYKNVVTPIMPYKFFDSVTLYIPVDGGDELVFNIIGSASTSQKNNKILEKLNEFIAYKNGYIGNLRKSINIYETIFSNFYDKIKIRHTLKQRIFNIPINDLKNISTKFDELLLDYIKHTYNKNILKIIKRNLIDYLLMPAIKKPIHGHNIYNHIISSFGLFNNLFLSFINWREINDFIVQNITIDFFVESDEKILELENELNNIYSNTEFINKIIKINNYNLILLSLLHLTSLTSLTFGEKFNQPIIAGSLPNSLTHLTFGEKFNQPIIAGSLPNSLTHLTFGSLTFGSEFDQPIVAGSLPNSLTRLTFGEKFNQPIIAGFLPNSLTHLTFGSLTFLGEFNQPIVAGSLPDSLTHLTFGKDFNQPIVAGTLPNSLTRLKFGYKFNQPIIAGSLPNSLTHLEFGSKFNQPIVAGSLPNSLTHLIFGVNFNQPIVAGSLPNSLTHLTFESFNQPIVAGSLPNNLTHLTFGDYFNQPIVAGSLPNSLTHLKFGYFKQPIVAGSLPNSLTHLEFVCSDQPIVAGSLPNSLTHLTMYDFNQPIVAGSLPNSLTHLTMYNFNQPIFAGSLPNSLTHLTFCCFDQQIIAESLPNSLTHLRFNTHEDYNYEHCFNQQIVVGSLPNSLTHLTLPYSFNQPIVVGSLPNSLTHLNFSDFNYLTKFNQPIVAGSLPNSLTHLTMYDFNQPIVAGSLPNSLTHLTFGYYFNQPIVAGSLPNSLTHLTFGHEFNQPIVAGSLPNSLTHLTMNDFNQPIVDGSLPNSLTHLTI